MSTEPEREVIAVICVTEAYVTNIVRLLVDQLNTVVFHIYKFTKLVFSLKICFKS